MKLNPEVEKYRVKEGPFTSKTGETHGAFRIHYPSHTLTVIACAGSVSDETKGWDHVSVSLQNRMPTWAEMCRVKELFFGDDETVVQFHPKESEYVRPHPHCLHLWKKIDSEFELPPSIMV